MPVSQVNIELTVVIGKEGLPMIQELEITPATVILVLIIIALAVLAIRRMTRRGLCDCHDDKCEGGCACGSVDKMVANMERAMQDASKNE